MTREGRVASIDGYNEAERDNGTLRVWPYTRTQVLLSVLLLGARKFSVF